MNSSLPKILFVDDESLVLHALKRALRPLCNECVCIFATGPHEALELLKRESFSIVVSDMRMPEIDGAMLLQKFKEETPDTVRVILSGQASAETVIRSLSVTHQYMAKPINSEYLQALLRSLLKTDSILPNPLLRRKISQLSAIPTLESTLNELNKMVEADAVSHSKLCELAKKDVGLVARLLHLTGLSSVDQRTCATFAELVSACSAQMLLMALKSKELFASVPDDSDLGKLITQVSDHSVRIARVVNEKFNSNSVEERSIRFVGALLHDFGKVLIAHLFEDISSQSLPTTKIRLENTSKAEEMLFGANHAQVGAYLASIWGLDDGIVSLIYNHSRSLSEMGDLDPSLVGAHAHILGAKISEELASHGQ